MKPALLALALAGALTPALATDRGQWEGVPWEIRQWYRNAELTKEAQTRFTFKKCCDHSDVVKTKFQVNKVDGRDEWWWWDEDNNGGHGGWRRIPDDVIHWQEHAPNRQPTLFIYGGKETCFFPGDGGI